MLFSSPTIWELGDFQSQACPPCLWYLSLAFCRDLVRAPAEPPHTFKVRNILLQGLWSLIAYCMKNLFICFLACHLLVSSDTVLFRVLQEAADNLLLSMQLTFSDLSLPCLSSCFFRPRGGPGSAINESHHFVLLPFSALLWTFAVHLHLFQGGELKLQPISNMQENHWHNDEPFRSLMRQILKYSSSLVNKSLSQL